VSVSNRTTAEHYVWGGVCDGWRLLDRPDLSVIEERIPPGKGEVRHLHTIARQLFFVLAGRLTIETADGIHTLAEGDALEIAPGNPHLVRNASEADVRFLVISAPATRGDRTNLD
jgi:mannose-6-phosphate isomerase-like protein (cupin superfamily)